MNMHSTAMIDLINDPKAADAVSSNVNSPKARYLFGPKIDFFCLGGSSLIFIPFIFMLPEEGLKATTCDPDDGSSESA